MLCQRSIPLFSKVSQHQGKSINFLKEERLVILLGHIFLFYLGFVVVVVFDLFLFCTYWERKRRDRCFIIGRKVLFTADVVVKL